MKVVGRSVLLERTLGQERRVGAQHRHSRRAEVDTLLAEAKAMAADIADGPSFANGITKTMLAQEWNMSIEAALESEAQAQAICMATQDFHRAFKAFASKQTPVFEGN